VVDFAVQGNTAQMNDRARSWRDTRCVDLGVPKSPVGLANGAKVPARRRTLQARAAIGFW